MKNCINILDFIHDIDFSLYCYDDYILQLLPNFIMGD
jgi:hypothetical protein